MKTLVLVLLLVPSIHSRFFDVCPSRRISIGACLAGLCPAGSECINSYCCKIKSSSTTEAPTVDESVEENEEYGKCPNGRHAIGECISNSCPKGYSCVNKLCCKPGRPPVRVTMIPVEVMVTKKPKLEELELATNTSNSSTPSSLITVPSIEIKSSTIIPEAEEISEEDIETTTMEVEEELSELESIKNALKKKISSEDETVETTTIDEEDDIDENIIDEREEVDDITTTSTTTTTTTTTPPTTTTTTSRRRLRTRRPTTSTTTTTTTTEPEPETTTEEVTQRPRRPQTTIEPEDLNIQETGCPVGEPIGECVSNQCPEGHSCFHSSCCILTPQINCTDSLSGCMPHLCNQRGYNEFMTKTCARTCARCHLVDLDKSGIGECRDRRSDCADWAEEGFCESTLYTTRQKLKFCGKSCKLC